MFFISKKITIKNLKNRLNQKKEFEYKLKKSEDNEKQLINEIIENKKSLCLLLDLYDSKSESYKNIKYQKSWIDDVLTKFEHENTDKTKTLNLLIDKKFNTLFINNT